MKVDRLAQAVKELNVTVTAQNRAADKERSMALKRHNELVEDWSNMMQFLKDDNTLTLQKTEELNKIAVERLEKLHEASSEKLLTGFQSMMTNAYKSQVAESRHMSQEVADQIKVVLCEVRTSEQEVMRGLNHIMDCQESTASETRDTKSEEEPWSWQGPGRHFK